MSSWKKAFKSNQKTHRERHQPEHRKHLGLLEKKKDYKLRANDEQEKAATLKLLRKRALNKNPDEFYHHMINSKVKEGEHIEKDKEDVHTNDQIQLMQTQDIKYITMKRTIETKKIKRLQSQLHLIDAANNYENKHTIFVDSTQELKKFNLAKHLDTHPSLLDRRTNRLKMSALSKMTVPDIDEANLQQLNKKREQSYNELSKRIEREKELSIVQQKMEIKRSLQEKRKLKPTRKQGGTKNNAPVYEFKYERKR